MFYNKKEAGVREAQVQHDMGAVISVGQLEVQLFARRCVRAVGQSGSQRHRLALGVQLQPEQQPDLLQARLVVEVQAEVVRRKNVQHEARAGQVDQLRVQTGAQGGVLQMLCLPKLVSKD